MLLSLNRISSDEKIFQLQLSDLRGTAVLEHKYILRRRREYDMYEDIAMEFSIDRSDSRLSISYIQDNVFIDFADKVELNGTGYLYQIERIITDEFDQDTSEYSNVIYGESLPSAVQGFYINDAESIYESEVRIPTKLSLTWDMYDVLENNHNVIGFHIYYSTSPKGENVWDEWNKVRDLTTSGGVDISLLQPTDTTVIIDVPQLSQSTRPCDIRFSIVAVTASTQSKLSEIDYVTTHNMAGAQWYLKNGVASIVNGTVENTESQIAQMKLIDPHYVIEIGQGVFNKDTFVWCERIKANEARKGISTIEYFINATSTFLEPFDLSFYLPLKANIQIDIREEVDGNMVSLPFTHNPRTKMATFSLATSKKFEIRLTNTDKTSITGIYQSIFHDITRKMLKRLPTWFKMRRNPVESVGAYFLEVFGLEMADVENILEYAGNQTHASSLDGDQLGTIYKIQLPHDISEQDMFAVEGDGITLELSPNLSHFLKPPYFLSDEEMIYHNSLFIVDYKEKVLYTRRYFEQKKDAPYGKAWVHIYRNEKDTPWYKSESILESHKLWNFYDEFGLLLDVVRLKDEENEAFMERILDVFKNPSNSAREGLMNGIARELGIRKNLIWEDTTKDFIIKDPMVMCNMITLDGEKLQLSDIWFSSDDYIVIKGSSEKLEPINVSYVTGLEMHSLNNKSDKTFYNQLFQPNGLATNLLLRYVKRIKDEIPIEWDSFKWNEGYWDASLPENGGVACVPSVLDASIVGFMPYNSQQYQ